MSAPAPESASTSAATPAPDVHEPTARRRATRNGADPVLGGVASGVAEHLGRSVVAVRAFFVLTVMLNGFGVVLYAALWAFLPSGNKFSTEAPGLEGARRDGRRPGGVRAFTDWGSIAVLTVLGVGALFVFQAIFGVDAVLLPLLLAGAGVALLWRQADEAQRERWFDVDGRIDPIGAVLGAGARWRIVAGVALLLLAAGVFALSTGELGLAWDVWVAVALSLAGVAIVVGPWLYRLATDLGAEREQRIRTQERADMAAHLHDSVLQTLALIQRNAEDPAAVMRLARSQERELRTWLFSDEDQTATSLAAGLRDAVERIEAEHDLSVDLVTVGDSADAEAIRPVVAAAGEALVNVAKHAQVAKVDVYAECSPDEIEVFIRDRGVGFDPAAVGEDRQGVAGSIVARMERHGGSATVRSAPGEGTEVRLRMPLGSTSA